MAPRNIHSTTTAVYAEKRRDDGATAAEDTFRGVSRLAWVTIDYPNE